MQWDVLSWLQACLTVARSCDHLQEIRFQVSRTHSSTPSPECLWAGDSIMPVIQNQVRTHNDSMCWLTELLTNAFVHAGLHLTWKHVNERTRTCAQRANHSLNHVAEKVVSLCDTCTGKACTIRSRCMMCMVRSCLLVVSLKCMMIALLESRTLAQSYCSKMDTRRRN